ncbi:MAG: twin-arginine translocase subunit TatC [Phycisphaerae bacterium]|nr:twin-arginine translocase subunit TatC [Gemmatimonadaceae bacterium]
MRRIDRSSHEMPFLEHLEELRWRIIWSALAFVASVAIGFYIVLHYDVVHMLEQPILPYLNGHKLVATHPTDGLQITISAAMWIGCILAFPIVLYQAWLFFSPALYPRERRLLMGALTGGILLFVAGAGFAYTIILPITLPWLIGLMGTMLEPMITGQNYFGLLFSTLLSFGLAFELPVVVLLLTAAGLVSPQLLSRFRRHAIVLIVAGSAFLTPGDFVWGTLALSLPLYLLYEVSVLAARVIWRRRHAGDTSVIVLLAPLLLMKSRRTAAVAA